MTFDAVDAESRKSGGLQGYQTRPYHPITMRTGSVLIILMFFELVIDVTVMRQQSLGLEHFFNCKRPRMARKAREPDPKSHPRCSTVHPSCFWTLKQRFKSIHPKRTRPNHLHPQHGDVAGSRSNRFPFVSGAGDSSGPPGTRGVVGLRPAEVRPGPVRSPPTPNPRWTSPLHLSQLRGPGG